MFFSDCADLREMLSLYNTLENTSPPVLSRPHNSYQYTVVHTGRVPNEFRGSRKFITPGGGGHTHTHTHNGRRQKPRPVRRAVVRKTNDGEREADYFASAGSDFHWFLTTVPFFFGGKCHFFLSLSFTTTIIIIIIHS